MELHSEQLDKIGAAMVKCQAAIQGAIKNSKNPHFKSDYADLAAVWDSVRVPLTDNGLSVIQSTTCDSDTNKEYLITTLLHVSGQWFKSKKYLKPGRIDNMQGDGSAITYARRYCLAAMLGVPQVDDDGNACDGKRKQAAPVKVTQLDMLRKLIQNYTNGLQDKAKIADICTKLNITELTELKSKDEITISEMVKYMQGLTK